MARVISFGVMAVGGLLIAIIVTAALFGLTSWFGDAGVADDAYETTESQESTLNLVWSAGFTVGAITLLFVGAAKGHKALFGMSSNR